MSLFTILGSLFLDHCCVTIIGSSILLARPFSAESEIVVTFRASSEVERQKWVTALELAKAKAIQVHLGRSEDVKQDVADDGV